MEFKISTVTAEEELQNTAMSIVMGYPNRHLGKRQEERLRRMAVYGEGNWGYSWDERRILEPLIRRGLVWLSAEGKVKADNKYRLTALGQLVGEIIHERWEQS